MFVASSFLSRSVVRSNSTASRALWLGGSSRFFSDKKAPKKAAPAVKADDDPSQHRPPIQLNGLAARYANATYVVASKQNVLPKVESDLLALAAAAASSPKVAQFLQNPLLPRSSKYQVVASMEHISPVTRNLLGVLAGNARLQELPKIAAAFSQLMKAQRGQVDVKIISAEPLSAAQLQQVEQALQHQVPPGKTAVVEAVVDPSMVGGLQVQMGDAFLDLSIKGRLDAVARMPVA